MDCLEGPHNVAGNRLKEKIGARKYNNVSLQYKNVSLSLRNSRKDCLQGLFVPCSMSACRNVLPYNPCMLCGPD